MKKFTSTRYGIKIKKKDGSDAGLLCLDDIWNNNIQLVDDAHLATTYFSVESAITDYKIFIFIIEDIIDTEIYDTRDIEIVPVYTTVKAGEPVDSYHINL